jgi:modulator of drug activity B
VALLCGRDASGLRPAQPAWGNIHHPHKFHIHVMYNANLFCEGKTVNIFLINGGKAFAHSGGRYNDALHAAAVKHLGVMGHTLRETHIDAGYVVEDEVAKYLWANLIIYQMPAWWMGAPWHVKKYLDEVLTAGHGKIYTNDGRASADTERNYGRGGLLQGRAYMLSVTWNAPQGAFDLHGEFFEARGVDAVYFPFHKSQEFIGLRALPTFMANNVMKAPAIEHHVRAYEQHLSDLLPVFSPSHENLPAANPSIPAG